MERRSRGRTLHPGDRHRRRADERPDRALGRVKRKDCRCPPRDQFSPPQTLLAKPCLAVANRAAPVVRPRPNPDRPRPFIDGTPRILAQRGRPRASLCASAASYFVRLAGAPSTCNMWLAHQKTPILSRGWGCQADCKSVTVGSNPTAACWPRSGSRPRPSISSGLLQPICRLLGHLARAIMDQ